MRRLTALFALYFLGWVVGLSAQTLNMSRDLVSLGIASQNLTPDSPTLDARPLVQAALQYAQNHPSVTTLAVDTGSYYFLSNQQSNAVLVFNLSNVTVDFAGSTVYFTGPLLPGGFFLYFCSHLTLTNFQVDYLNLPYTEVQLTSVDTTNRLLHYQTLPGWPDPTAFNSLSSAYGPLQNWAAIFRNGVVVPGTSRTVLAAPFNGGVLTISDPAPWAQAPVLSTLQPGDTVVVTERGAGPPIGVWGGDSVTLSNVTVYASSTWAVDFYYTSNSTADNVRVQPRPGGLISSDADGIHFTTMLQNNCIHNCYVAATLDDALAMDSMYVGTVVGQSGTQVTVTRFQYSLYPNGALLNFVDPTTTLETVGAHVIAQNPPYANSPGFNEQVVLTFDQVLPPLAAGAGMVYGDANNRGQGSFIEDSTVGNTYGGHGIWVTGVQGVTVQRNVVRQTSMGGIALERTTDPDGFPGPGESNVVVQSNAMEADLGPAACGTGVQDCMAAIDSVTTNNQSFSFATQPSNNNITIANNYIADSGRSGIWLGEVASGTLQNNLILRSSQAPNLSGVYGIPTTQLDTEVMQDALQPLVVRYSGAVTQTGNVFASSSPITTPVTLAPAGVTLPALSFAGIFTVQPVITGFDWLPFSDSPWLTVTSGSGPGAGTVEFALSPNATGSSRTGHIRVAGELFTVTQTTQMSFSPCDLAQNGNISIVDVQSVLNEALGLAKAVHDLNGDGVLNVADIQIETNAVLAGTCSAH